MSIKNNKRSNARLYSKTVSEQYLRQFYESRFHSANNSANSPANGPINNLISSHNLLNSCKSYNYRSSRCVGYDSNMTWNKYKEHVIKSGVWVIPDEVGAAVKKYNK